MYSFDDVSTTSEIGFAFTLTARLVTLCVIEWGLMVRQKSQSHKRPGKPQDLKI